MAQLKNENITKAKSQEIDIDWHNDYNRVLLKQNQDESQNVHEAQNGNGVITNSSDPSQAQHRDQQTYAQKQTGHFHCSLMKSE